MRAYSFDRFGLDHLRLDSAEDPRPGPGEALLDVRAISLNYRDLLVIRGQYNPRLRLPAVPVSDGAGVVTAVGEGVRRVRVGDAVMTHFVAGWLDGPFRLEYLRTTLGAPGPGLAVERAVVPAEALLPLPAGYDFAQAATLPIAALTAWSALVTVGRVQAGQTVLALGTGGVSIFALQMARALGARVIITSSSDEKLARARSLGADVTVNYRGSPDWDAHVLSATGGQGVDLTVETVGGGTINRSIGATRAGGVIAFLGALTGLAGEVNLGALMMKRIQLAGIMVDSRAAFEQMCRFVEKHALRPVIDRVFAFEQLPEALRFMESGGHFGKIVLTRQ
jgi:NADPH:quinone reductase-like Zn-dependent oxidoreductase